MLIKLIFFNVCVVSDQDVYIVPGTNTYFTVFSVCAVLGVFLWPLISCHEVSLWIEPVLQKLDFGIGGFLQKIKENHGNSDTCCVQFCPLLMGKNA